jgi:DNA-binding NarL/FixJ family response regulator
MDDEPNPITGRSRRTHLKARIKVLVGDSRQLLAEALAFALRSDRGFEVVGTQTDLNRLVADVARLVPDVLVLDYETLIRSDESDIVFSIRIKFPDVRILVVIQFENAETLLACLRVGAAGYITKDLPLVELERAIRRLHAGDTLFAPGPLTNLLRRLQPQVLPKGTSPEFQPLGAREREILQIIATGLSTEETAMRLDITVHTVRTHLKNLMRKLEVHSKLDAVILAIRRGIIDSPGLAD